MGLPFQCRPRAGRDPVKIVIGVRISALERHVQQPKGVMMTVQEFANKFADQLDQQADAYHAQSQNFSETRNLAKSELLGELSSLLRIIGNEARRAASIHG